MDVDDGAEYGFDPAEDIDVSSRRVGWPAGRAVPRGHAASHRSVSGTVQQCSWQPLLHMRDADAAHYIVSNMALAWCSSPCCPHPHRGIDAQGHWCTGGVRGADRAAAARAAGRERAIGHLGAGHHRWRGCSGAPPLQVVRAVHAAIALLLQRATLTRDAYIRQALRCPPLLNMPVSCAGIRSVSMTSILPTWTGCGTSWASWMSHPSLPARWRQQRQQRQGQQPGKANLE